MFHGIPLFLALDWPLRKLRNFRRERRFHRNLGGAEEFLRKHAPVELRPSALAPLTVRQGRFTLRAETPTGTTVAKFYQRRRLPIARRCAILREILCERGFPVPRLLFSATDQDATPRKAMTCMIWEFIPSPANPPDRMAVGLEAMALLGRMHSIAAADIAPRLAECDGGRVWNQPTEQWLTKKARYVADLASRDAGGVTRQGVESVLGSITAAARDIRKDGGAESLLFMDFQRGNTIPRADGGLCLLDFEMASIGAPCWDIAYGATAFALGASPANTFACELMESDPFKRLLEAYFTAAPAWIRAHWERHWRAACAWGYLCRIRTMLNKALRPSEHTLAARFQLLRNARKGWLSLARFVEGG